MAVEQAGTETVERGEPLIDAVACVYELEDGRIVRARVYGKATAE